jgi:hypothetical protein
MLEPACNLIDAAAVNLTQESNFSWSEETVFRNTHMGANFRVRVFCSGNALRPISTTKGETTYLDL